MSAEGLSFKPGLISGNVAGFLAGGLFNFFGSAGFYRPAFTSLIFAGRGGGICFMVICINRRMWRCVRHVKKQLGKGQHEKRDE
ncbi:hypothetical protein VRB66_10060 [Erwinia sp. E_sp_B01_9]